MKQRLLAAFMLAGAVLPAGFPLGLPSRTLSSAGGSPVRGQAPPADRAEELLADMGPDERVGQLLLIAFDGAEPEEPILDLIRRGHVSGVVLRAANDNFTPSPGTAADIEALIDTVQQTRLSSSSTEPTPQPTEAPTAPVYVPLFVALSLNREGSADPEIQSGLSEPVTPMALGAAWDPALAEDAGEQTGRELAALGFNLVLGPSLDVLDEASQGSPGDLGVEGFGGDPYWVSELGRAFVRGLHTGGANRLGVLAKHFPGTGSSDRPPSDEVAAVRKSIEGLRQVDLAPFFSVTLGVPGEDASTVDGVLLSHLRYQGLQGNIRQTTRPVSLDRSALTQILGLDTLPAWRLAGGLIVSDSLGSRAVRRFFDPSEQTFSGPQVAREAFQAGSDLLLLEDFVSSSDPDQATTVRKTLEAFVTRYREDVVFAEQVDEAALRILRLKLRLYGGRFSPQSVVLTPGVSRLQPSSALAFLVARKSASRVSPAELTPEMLALVPTAGQRLVVFTDLMESKQCSACVAEAVISVDSFEQTIADLYGPRAGGQARPWNLTSFSMADLAYMLGERPPSDAVLSLADSDNVGAALDAADWVVFNVLSAAPARYGTDALKLLLDRHPERLQGKQIVVFAFGAPYPLDATDLSKVDLYYALYASGPSFVGTAARLLYQELNPEGDPPVSVPGVGYRLLDGLSPDPGQKIGLQVRSTEAGLESATPEAGFSVGDNVFLETSVVLDHNGRAVPDGTPVEFNITYPGESLSSVLQSTTFEGVAQATIRLDRTGLLTIRAASDQARVSDIVQLDVEQGVPAFATVIAPTPAPTSTSEATDTAVSPAVLAGQAGGSNGGLGAGGVALPAGALLLGLLFAGGAGGAGYYLLKRNGAGSRDSMRATAIGATGALLGFNYLALGLPGSNGLMLDNAYLALALFCAAGGAAGVFAASSWWKRGWQR
ncbi:MAG TPA: glycoside hydrolase family 3 N-terminal domain-containing protein [Anaerolineales bacterium]|nr:glycoside hydrolase family 3 N-terminal domain-containing protein [Anaerolineales bacterium]